MKFSYRARIALIALLLALSTLFASCDMLGGLPVTTDPVETTTAETTLEETSTEESSYETTPETSTPEATTPEETTPEVTTPEVTTPEVTTPEVTSPEVTTPEESTPDSEQPEKPPVGTEVGNTCPTISLDIVDSEEKFDVQKETAEGRVVVLNFWFNTCPPCLWELPSFYRMAADYADRVSVAAVHIELPGVDVTDFIENNSGHPEWNDGTMSIGWDTGMYCMDLFNIQACPLTIVINANGVITDKHLGALTYSELIAIVEKALDEPSQPEETTPEETTPEVTTPEVTTPEITTPEITTPGEHYPGIPAFSGEKYVAINGNVPYFTKEDYTTTSYESYAVLDSLGRCGVAVACLGRDLMPTGTRGDLSTTPSGWMQASYDIVDGRYLYNRSHLIGWQLAGEDDNKLNLITGTRFCNQLGMLPFENMVADYIKETNNHVLYRVTPLFIGNELVARGVLMEAWSVEDNGDGICFNVFIYNAQPGIIIDYATGSSRLEKADTTPPDEAPQCDYVANKNSKKFHYPECSSVDQMSEKNKEYHTATHDEMIQMGYIPCANCNP